MKTLKIILRTRSAHHVSLTGYSQKDLNVKYSDCTLQELYELGGNSHFTSFSVMDSAEGVLVVEDEDGNEIYRDADYCLYADYLKSEHDIADEWFGEEPVDEDADEYEDYQEDMEILNMDVSSCSPVLEGIMNALRNNEMEACEFTSKLIRSTLAVDDIEDFCAVATHIDYSDCESGFTYEIELEDDEEFTPERISTFCTGTLGKLECTEVLNEVLNTEDLIYLDFLRYGNKMIPLADIEYNSDGTHDYDEISHDIVDISLNHIEHTH